MDGLVSLNGYVSTVNIVNLWWERWPRGKGGWEVVVGF